MLDANDVEVGTGSAFSGPDGECMVSVASNERTLTKSQTLDYLIVCKLSGAAATGETLDFTINDITTGATTRKTGAPTATVEGFEIIAPSLILTDESAQNPLDVQVGSDKLVLHQFRLAHPGGTSAQVPSMTFDFSGLGDESSTFDRVALMLDVDDDGTLDPASDRELDRQAISSDDGAAIFQLSGADATFTAGDSRRYWLVVDTNLRAQNGDTFRARLTNVSVTPASIAIVSVPLPAQGATAGVQIVGDSALATIHNAGGSASVDNDPSGSTGEGELLLDFSLRTSNDLWSITSLAFAASGSGDDASAWTSMALYEDDGNGSFDGSANDSLAATLSSPLTSDNGTFSFSLLDNRFPPGQLRHFFLLATFSGGISGETYSVSLMDAVYSAPSSSLLLNVPSASGPIFTINQPRFDLSFHGPGTAQSVARDAGNVLLADLSISTRNQLYTLTEMRFTASGSGNDASAFSALALYEDTNGSGVFEAASDQLATASAGTAFSSDDGDFLASLVDPDFTGPSDRRFFLIATLNGSASPTQTFNAALTEVTLTQPAGLIPNGVPSAPSSAIIIDTPVVSVANAANAPMAGGEEAGQAYRHHLASFEFSASNGDGQVNALRLRGDGSANWVSALDPSNGVELYADSDVDGSLDDSMDQLLAASGGMQGAMDFTLTSPLMIPDGESRRIFVVINVLSTAGENVAQIVHDFRVALSDPVDVDLEDPIARVVLGMPAPLSATFSVVEWRIDQITPLRSVPVTGGQEITIRGSGFSAPLSLTIGGVDCSGSPQVNANGTEITGLRVPVAVSPNFHTLEMVLTTRALGARPLDQTFNYGAAKRGGSGGGCAAQNGEVTSAWWVLLTTLVIASSVLSRRGLR